MGRWRSALPLASSSRQPAAFGVVCDRLTSTAARWGSASPAGGLLSALYGQGYCLAADRRSSCTTALYRSQYEPAGRCLPHVLRRRLLGVHRRNITLPAAILRPHTAAGLESLVLVADRPGFGQAGVTAALTSAIYHQDPAARVVTPSGDQASVNAQIAQNAWTIHISVIVLRVYVVIPALNTLAMAALGRRTSAGSWR